LDEGICQSEEDRSAGDNGDDGLSQRGKGIAVDSSTFSGDDEDGGNGGEEVSGDEFDDSNNGGNTGVEGPMVLVEANKVVLICHEIQIIMPHRILIMKAN